MKISVWTVTSDTDSGLVTTVHATQADAYTETKGRFCTSREEEATFDQHIATGTFDDLNEYIFVDRERSVERRAERRQGHNRRPILSYNFPGVRIGP